MLVPARTLIKTKTLIKTGIYKQAMLNLAYLSYFTSFEELNIRNMYICGVDL